MEAPGQKDAEPERGGAVPLPSDTGGSAMGMGQCPGVPSWWEMEARLLRARTTLGLPWMV